MNSTIKKNDEYVVDIIDYGTDGEGIAKINGYTLFVNGALKGEKCKIHVTKVLTSYAYAKIVEIVEKSKHRLEPDCDTYKRCGGCSLRHIDYKETLKITKEKVQNLVNKMLKSRVEVNETIGMDLPYYYRNKTIYPIDGRKKIGFYSNRSHDIIPINECKIQTKLSQKIARYIVENYKGTIYNEETREGVLRNIMIREAFSSKEAMVVLVQTDSKVYIDVEKIVSKFNQIKTIVINVNKKDTNVVLSNTNVIVYGDGFITDKLGDYYFKISPNSFYQINPIQTERIYNYAIEKACLNKNDILCDLYCGIGTIGIFASKYVKKVYGIEIVPQAIKNAKENAKENDIMNIEFMEGDVELAFDKLLKNNVKPNVVIVDPPRKGLDKKTILNLCDLNLERLIYISCNPATLVRDLSELEKYYDIKTIQPFDNFCYTSHVECCSVLSLRD